FVVELAGVGLKARQAALEVHHRAERGVETLRSCAEVALEARHLGDLARQILARSGPRGLRGVKRREVPCELDRDLGALLGKSGGRSRAKERGERNGHEAKQSIHGSSSARRVRSARGARPFAGGRMLKTMARRCKGRTIGRAADAAKSKPGAACAEAPLEPHRATSRPGSHPSKQRGYPRASVAASA